MKKLALLAAVALLVVAPVAAHANEPAKEAPAATETTTMAPVEHTLKDGTKISVEGDVVSVVAADGTKTAAPDGEHELTDGTKITVKEGKLVK